MSELIPVVLADGEVEYVTSDTVVTWVGMDGPQSISALHREQEMPYPGKDEVILPDGRVVRIEGSRNEALRLRDECEKLRHRLEEAERQLDLIGDINEEYWESGEAACWIFRIRCGESVDLLKQDGFKTQEKYEASYCTGWSRELRSKG